jgi:hypothetical protein
VTDSDLLVIAPWVVFVGGLLTLVILAVARDGRPGRHFPRWRRRRRRH